MSHTITENKDGLNTFSVECECAECKGTGLYVGLAERDGAAVVCYRCNGTGKAKFEYQWREFAEKKRKLNVVQVWRTGAGIVLAPGVCQGGVPYERWLTDPESVDAIGAENRTNCCPRMWAQSAGTKIQPDYDCDFGRFGDCKTWNSRSLCWAKFDTERRAAL